MKLTHPIFDVAGALAVVWLWTAIYESFTHTGLWSLIDDLAGNARGMVAEAAVLAASVLTGWFALAISSWGAWRVFARDVQHADFPVARTRA
jgi:hypothetical protein